ncbi:MAG: zinc-binding dehydrogenase [Alphaproteobacteria bacterium]
MSGQSRAAVFEAPNQPFVIRSFPLAPVEPGQVLARVKMSTICRSDVHSWEGKRHNPCPGILGHEIIGVIEEIGAEVGADMRGERLAPGDRITWTEFFYCGKCYYCRVLDMPQKCVALRKYGHDPSDVAPGLTGGFAEHCYLLPGTGILRLPPELSDEEATPVNCGVATMVAATEAAEITVGDAVVIQGLGLLGLYGVALARVRGAKTVIGLDSVPERLAMAKRFGADHAIDIAGLASAEIIKLVREQCRPDGPDAAIEVCGVPAVIPEGLAMLRRGGRYVIAGLVFPNANVTIDANLVLNRWLTLRGVHNYHPRHLVQAVDFVTRHRRSFPFRELVDAKFPLDQVNIAFRKAANREVLRAAVVP